MGSKVAFCEDEEQFQRLFCKFLRMTNYEVHVASDGLEGLAIVERERPDLVLIDILMPRCDGFQLARMIRSRPDLATTPIIFVTGFAQKYNMEEAAKYHPVAYLVKPFGAAYLRMTIEAAIQHARKVS